MQGAHRRCPAGAQEEEQRLAEEKAAAEKVQRDEERREARAAARAQAKKEGRLLTGKAKKEAERMAAFRAQLLANADVDLPGAAKYRSALALVLHVSERCLVDVPCAADPDTISPWKTPRWRDQLCMLHAGNCNLCCSSKGGLSQQVSELFTGKDGETEAPVKKKVVYSRKKGPRKGPQPLVSDAMSKAPSSALGEAQDQVGGGPQALCQRVRCGMRCITAALAPARHRRR